MKSSLVAFLLCLAAAVPCYAQASAEYVPLSSDQLDQLTARIALYPDALLTEILVASTYPDDVVRAAQWVKAGGDPSQIDSQGWDNSVKTLARYPEVLQQMASDPDWMNQLGAAFLNQQQDVMDSIQQLRAKASSAGNLVSNDKQQVVEDQGVIQIVPADPQVIYVPQYDPQVVYVQQPIYTGSVWQPLIGWGAGLAVGAWFNHSCDWWNHRVYSGNYGSNFINNVNMNRFNNGQWQNNQWRRNDNRPGPRPGQLPANRPNRPGSGWGGNRPGGRPTQLPADRNQALPNYGRGTDAARDSNRGRQSREGVNRPATPGARPSTPSAGQRPATPGARPSTPSAGQRPATPGARPSTPSAGQRPATPGARPSTPSAGQRPSTPSAGAGQGRPATPSARPTQRPSGNRPSATPARPRPSTPSPSARPSGPSRGGAMSGYQRGGDTRSISQRGQASRSSAASRGGGGGRGGGAARGGGGRGGGRGGGGRGGGRR